MSENRPTKAANDAEREVQIDEIIERLERLEAEAARLKALAARLLAARQPQPPTGNPDSHE